MIATGGAGQCFAVTTNPPLSTGDGIAMALRAGVAVADLEFMQFHPTALHHPSMPRPLLSEALRGEGAILRDDARRRVHGATSTRSADLAPRDVVARAISRRLDERGLDHLWLDATAIDGFADAVPDDLARLPDRRPRPDARLAAGRAGRALPVAAASAPTSTARPRCPASGRAARRRAPACTAPTAWRRTRCSKGWCSPPRWSRRSPRGKDAPDATGVLRGDRPRHAAVRASVVGRRSCSSGLPIRDELQRDDDARRRRRAERREPRPRVVGALAAMVPTDVEEANLLAVSTRARPCCHRALRVARHAHALRLSPSRRPSSSAGSCSPAIPPPTSCRCSPRAEHDAHERRSTRAGRRRPRGGRRALAEDLGPLGDLTAALVPARRAGRRRRRRARRRRARRHRVRDRGVRAARPDVQVNWLVDDGEARRRRSRRSATSPDRCGRVLTGERTALNFLCHLSGVATPPALRARGR